MPTVISSSELASSNPESLWPLGTLCVFPTDTVYGFGVRPDDQVAIDKLRQLKHRPSPAPLTLHLDRFESISKYVQTLTGEQKDWVQTWFPGAFTAILPAVFDAPTDAVVNGNIGLRVPDGADYGRFIKCFGPVLGTSVNEKGQPPIHESEGILRQFGDQISLMVTAEEAFRQEASAVIDLTQNPFKAIRGTLPSESVS